MAIRVGGLLAALILASLANDVAAQGFGATAETHAREAEGGNPSDQDSDSGPTSAGAFSNLAFGNAVAMSQAGASQNRLSARASVVGSGEFNSVLLANAIARWTDTLYFSREGVPLTSGTVRVSAHVDGLINELGPGSNGSAAFNLDLGSVGDGLGFEDSGTHSQSLAVTSTDDLTFGLPVIIGLSTSAVNGLDASTGESNFLSTAFIESVAYLNDQGRPDPTVQITSASGYDYPVPEPSTVVLGLLGLAGLLAAARRAGGRATPGRRPGL